MPQAGTGAHDPVPIDANWEPMLQFFEYAHLPVHLQSESAPFAVLAKHMATTLPRNPERTAGLRFLLQAKDCAVRARLYRNVP